MLIIALILEIKITIDFFIYVEQFINKKDYEEV